MEPDRRLGTKQRRSRISRLLERQAGLCYWCGCRLVCWRNIPHRLVVFRTVKFIVWRERLGTSQALLATLDHVVPISRGGSNDDENLVAACFWCNQDRADTGRSQLPAPSVTDPEPVSMVLWTTRHDA